MYDRNIGMRNIILRSNMTPVCRINVQAQNDQMLVP